MLLLHPSVLTLVVDTLKLVTLILNYFLHDNPLKQPFGWLPWWQENSYRFYALGYCMLIQTRVLDLDLTTVVYIFFLQQFPKQVACVYNLLLEAEKTSIVIVDFLKANIRAKYITFLLKKKKKKQVCSGKGVVESHVCESSSWWLSSAW